ncbi:MAG: helix-hairpin-helix domain-containing protein [Deltaproteobacteria bacterium]|nr:helix-hairpin-helix domain-containing protein [Deltaproteobacteria bacterium]
MLRDKRYGAFFLLATFMLCGFILGKDRFGRSYTDKASASAIRPAHEPFPGLPMDVNSASMDDLMSIPGIGEKTAMRIVEKRAELHGFSALDELTEVKYIGKAKLERLKRFVFVRPQGKRQG